MIQLSKIAAADNLVMHCGCSCFTDLADPEHMSCKYRWYSGETITASLLKVVLFDEVCNELLLQKSNKHRNFVMSVISQVIWDSMCFGKCRTMINVVIKQWHHLYSIHLQGTYVLSYSTILMFFWKSVQWNAINAASTSNRVAFRGVVRKKRSIETHPKTSHFEVVWERDKEG